MLFDMLKMCGWGIENADFETKWRNLETLQVEVVIKNGRFYVTTLAGKWDGEIRRIPMARKGKDSEEKKDNIVTSWQKPASVI